MNHYLIRMNVEYNLQVEAESEEGARKIADQTPINQYEFNDVDIEVEMDFED